MAVKKMAEPVSNDVLVTIKRDEKNPESLELIASAIIKIAEAARAINNGPLKNKTVYLLIKDATGVPMGVIEKVLNAAQSLEKTYLK